MLSGGGARGAFQIGVWEVLRDDPRGLGRAPDVISGTSAGALNGAMIAAGLEPKEILEFWLQMADDPPVVANAAFFRTLEKTLRLMMLREPIRSFDRRRRGVRIIANALRKHPIYRASGWLALLLQYLLTARFDSVSVLLEGIETSYLFSTRPARDRLAEVLGGRAIAATDVRLAINTVDIRTGEVVRFVNHPPHTHAEGDLHEYHYGPITVDMIMASASIPILFDPVTVGPHELWDGGLLVNTPLAPTVALGARRVIPVLVSSGKDQRPNRNLTLGVTVERLADAFLENAYNTDRKLLLERNRLASALPELDLQVVTLYEPIRPAPARRFNAGSYLYFVRHAMEEMYEAGREAALSWLAAGPPLDTHPGQPH